MDHRLAVLSVLMNALLISFAITTGSMCLVIMGANLTFFSCWIDCLGKLRNLKSNQSL